MEHYLEHTDYPIWEVIQKGNGPVQVSIDTIGQIKVLPPKTAEEILAKERERKARTTLLMAIPEDHLAKFYKMTDTKEIWEAIKSRFGRNDESKKMQKYILKQQFKSVSTEDANQKFLRVFESDVKGSTRSSSSTQNVAFVSFDNTSSTNDVNTTYGISTSFGHKSQKKGSSSYTDDLIAKLSASIATIHDTLLESADQKGIKTIEGERQETLDTRQRTMERDLQNRMNIKLWSSDVEDSHVNEKFAKVKGMHAVPPPMTENYMPPKSDFGIDESKFTYGPKQSTTSESDAKTSNLDSYDSSSSEETLETMPKQVESKPKVVNEPKVWSNDPIIEEYESDSDDEYVSKASVEQEKPSCAFNNTVKHVKTPSFSYLIRDCDFHKKRMDKQVELNKQIVNTARQHFTSQAASTSIARKVNTARPKENELRPRHNVYKSHLPIRRPFNRTTAPKANFTQHKVNTVRDKSVSAIGGNWETAIKASTGCNWRYKRHYWNRDNPHQTLKGKGIVNNGCFRHMIGNKAYLVDYQDFNGGPVAFGGSKGQITDTECLVLSPDFKLPNENEVLLRVSRQHNMYSFNLENIVPSRGLAFLIAKATTDESTKLHKRLGHYPEIHPSSLKTSYEVFQANHSIENEESFENPSDEIAVSSSNLEEPPQDFNICQLIRKECCVEAREEQKRSMEDTIALISKPLLINSNSQRLDKKEQEVKNVVEQPAEHGNRSIQSLYNFRVVHKSSISFRNTSQISSIHAVAPILSTKELEHLLSMRYEHLNITPETESDEVTEFNAEKLLPIPSKCEVALEDKRECDVPISENSPIYDNHSDTFSDSKIDDDISVYDDDFENIEYVEASLSDLEIASVEEENVVQQEEEEVDFDDISQIQDIVLREKTLSIIRLISNIESLNDNSTFDRVLNSFESDNSVLDNFLPEFETFCDHSKETRSGNTTHVDYSLPEYDSFCFEIKPDQERLINLVKNDFPHNSSNDSLLEEVDLFLADNSIPSGIENVADDQEGDIRFLEEFLIDDSMLSHESSDFNFEDNPSIPRPPLEPPNVETDTEDEIPVMMIDKDKFDDDYHYFMFDKVFSLLFAKNEDTIFDPGISD
nr:xylulose kinase-1 [Tanacetum cinerariifolium]